MRKARTTVTKESFLKAIEGKLSRNDQIAASGLSRQGFYNVVKRFDINLDSLDSPKTSPSPAAPRSRGRTVKNEVTQEYFTKAFEASGRIVSRTAKTLMMNIQTTRKRVEQYGLTPVDGRYVDRTPKAVAKEVSAKEQVSTLKPHQKARLEIAWAGLAESIEDFFGNDDYV